MQNQNEIWQTDVNGQIYESSFEELTQWINDGSLLPQDMVRRGNLRWIQAQKVPSLIPFFNAKDNGLPPPVVTSTTKSENSETIAIETNNFQQIPPQKITPNGQSGYYTEFRNFANSLERVNHTVEIPPVEPQISANCCIHDNVAAVFYCETCGNSFCPVCVKSYGGNVKICSMCGAMCKSFKELEKAQKAVLPNYANEPFGFGDFGRAVTHPFKFKTSLFLGALMFSVFTIGQNAGAMGGFFMMGAALFCFLLANMMTFGVLKNTIDNFSQGKLETNFMPSFDDFSLWDDCIHPFFLSLGAYLVSFGPLILIVIIGAYITISSVTKQVSPNQLGMPQTQQFQNGIDTAEQSERVKKLLENEENRSASVNQNPNGYVDTEEEVRQANELINQHRKAQLESTIGKSPETSKAEQTAMITQMVTKALPFVLLGIVALIFGLLFFPAACAVAGYTQTFRATINPLVVWDTIKTFGFDYVKILLMCVLLGIFSGMMSFMLNLILSPFNLPRMGNIPAMFLSGFITFYISCVFSCILGYAIFKNADKFKLNRN
ncbi:MAG TPA: hypothetical protein PKY59_04540 [Pyrinomonadaceae bacterium]|nr:hypothetical protein [Pyrinomonadaceae bacterium]